MDVLGSIIVFVIATHNRLEVDTGSTSDIREQKVGLSDMTKERGHSNTTDDIITEAPPAAKRKTTQDAEDGDLQATKRRLETLLQLETHARRTMEENFQRVKGSSFVLLSIQDEHWTKCELPQRLSKQGFNFNKGQGKVTA